VREYPINNDLTILVESEHIGLESGSKSMWISKLSVDKLTALIADVCAGFSPDALIIHTGKQSVLRIGIGGDDGTIEIVLKGRSSTRISISSADVKYMNELFADLSHGFTPVCRDRIYIYMNDNFYMTDSLIDTAFDKREAYRKLSLMRSKNHDSELIALWKDTDEMLTY